MSDRMRAPLSKTQMGIYVECMENKNSTMYNLPFIAKLESDINVTKLKNAIEKAIQAHPCLETVIYTDQEGNVMQQIERGSFQLKEYHMTDDEFVKAKEKLVRPFSLDGGSLCRYEIYYTPSANYLFQDIHHILIDGTSHGQILARDVRKAYDGESLKKEEYTGIDVAMDETALYGSEAYLQAKQFFEDLLDGHDGDCLPVPDVYADVPKQGWHTYDFSLNLEQFEEFRKNLGVSITSYFTAVMGFLIARYNYRDDSVIATVYDGRKMEKKREVVSMLVKTLPFVTDLSGNPAVSEFLKKSNDALKKSRQHELYSFEEMATEYGVNADINFAFQGKLLEYQLMAGSNMKVERIYDENHIENTPLLFELSDLDGGNYELHIGYRADMFSDSFIENMARAYGKIAHELLVCQHVDDVELVDEIASRQINKFNATEHPYDKEKTVIDHFRNQVKQNPDREALVYLDKHFTYGQLDEITDRLAKDLKKKGIGKDIVTGVLIPRCQYMVICALGILKAGGGYLPLDPTYPPERLNLMMKDSGAKVLLTTEDLNPIIGEEFTGIRMMVDEIPQLPDQDEVLVGPKPEDLFIMLYTSGSTGLPKGVMLEHGNLAAFCDWARRYYNIDETTRSAAYASFGFDANMFDTYPVLTAGGTLYIIDESIRLNLIKLQEYYNQNGITHSLITTQVGRQFALMENTKTLRHLTVGGEKLVPLDPPSYHMYNAYGPTECTIMVTVAEVDQKYKDVPIGPALDNVKLYVVDKNGKMLPVGAAGELWVAGPQVARSYLNRPEKTAEAFTQNPFCQSDGYERVYHTGDVVRFMEDGSVQFIGRRDAQVKVRGFRIELTEVEEIIRKFPGIKDATVAAYDDPAGGKYIAAYVVSDGIVSVDALNAFIMEEKPPYMVPAVTMQIDEIPMTQNQKVNKRALPVPERKFENVEPPQNETQQKIFDIVAEVIGSDSFGINTSIHMAGLTSVGAVRLNVLLSKAFNKAVQTRDLKEYDTVEKLESFLMSSEDEEDYKQAKKQNYLLTKNQEGIFVESMAHPDSTIYNIPILLELSDELDIQQLKTAIVAAVEAHPYVKTQLFMDDNGDIRQKRMDHIPFSMEQIEVIETKGFEPKSADLVKPFALMENSLLRIKIIKAEKTYLFIEMHHIISDGTSMNILLNDISRVYAGETLQGEVYSGFEAATFEEEQRASSHYEEAVAYYKEVFAGCDADCLPSGDLKKGIPQSEEIQYIGNYAMSEDVKHFCESNRLTMNGFFTAVFGLVLSKYARKEETVFTTIYNGRNDSRLAESVAMLVKTFPVKCDVSKENGNTSIINYVAEVAEQLMESMSNDIYSFSEISRELGINADVMFAYQGESFNFDEMCGKPAKLINLKLDDVKAPLNLNVYLKDGRIQYSLEYRSDQFSHEYAEGFLDAMDMAVLEFLTKETIRQVSILSDAARAKVESFNDTKGEVENLTAPQLLEKQAKRCPDKIAVTAGKVSITFDELNKRANKIAHVLLNQGIGAQDIVALYMDRTVDVYSVRQGIMKSGAAFLSTDPEYPDERISYIIENAGAKHILTTTELYEKRKELLDGLQVKVLLLEDIYSTENDENPKVLIDPESLAYCIYTSGSTGKPKGVMIEHRNLMNLLAYHDKNILAKAYVDNTTVFLGLAAITFDVSIIEEMMPIYHGQSVAMATEEEIHNPILLAKMMEETGVDMMKCTPSYMMTMLDFPESSKVLSELNAIIIGAEPFPVGLYEKMRAAGFKGKIFNSYGPTETTVTVTIDELDGEHITIGRPAGNTGILTVDHFDQILPPFAKGELIITGDSVGRGYIGLPKQTQEKFITMDGQKAYRSGDIAYLQGNGKIIHCGRSDNQIKLRGLRVELDEIENTMNRFEGIKRSVVLVKGEGNDQTLCGYYVSEVPVDTQELTAFMSKTLTNYMIPAVFVHLESMPMTANGKVDKRALPEPVITIESRSGRVAQTELEKKFCDMFAMALGMDQVYADDDFFALGGTSLSASKVAMKCMTEQINVAYADIFEYPTPEKLASYVGGQGQRDNAGPIVLPSNAPSQKQPEALYEVLKYNQVDYLDEIQQGELGNVLVTGATGFLGVHVVRELLDAGYNKVFCLVRKGNRKSVEVRLKMMFMYYFDDTMEDKIGSSIIPIDGDITDTNLAETLEDYDFDTVINCAASVKHFAADDLLDRVNVQGVKNLIDICLTKGKKLVQVSTVSIAGESVDNHIPETVQLTENSLDLGQALDNKYAETKFMAEKAILEAVSKGLRGKIIRVGNLMSREKDGEFQINYSTNGFMNRLRAYSMIGAFPVSSMDQAAEFSPIDFTAKALVRLAGTPDQFTVFHAYNCHHVHMANVLAVMNECGISIDVVKDDVFRKKFNALLADESKNMEISSLIAYMNSGKENRRYVGWDNSFTVKALYRLGFSWPLTGEGYIHRSVEALSTLGFFDGDGDE